jgi:multimeric flavodoxin WrbA
LSVNKFTALEVRKESYGMKVIVINGSPNMDKGNTALILTPFIGGMMEAGAEVEVFYIKKLKIKPCEGEFNCWIKNPGVCIHRDDMDWLLPKLGESDLLVLAVPLFVDDMPGPVKTFIDRLIPRGDIRIEIKDGRCRHPIREGFKPLPVALVSNCGFWEMENFDLLLQHVKGWAEHANSPFLGAVLRPTGPILRALLDFGNNFDDIFQAVKEAGRQLIKQGKMSDKTLDTISRPIMTKEEYVESHNAIFNDVLEDLAEEQSKGNIG